MNDHKISPPSGSEQPIIGTTKRKRCTSREKCLIPAVIFLVFMTMSLIIAIIYTGVGRERQKQKDCECVCPNDTKT